MSMLGAHRYITYNTPSGQVGQGECFRQSFHSEDRSICPVGPRGGGALHDESFK